MRTSVNKSAKRIVALCIVALVAVGGYFGIPAIMSDNGLTISCIMSSSLQHDPNHSQIGVLDTGDVAVIKEASLDDIQSYVEGTVSGYRSFGDYGSVIIFEADSYSGNNIIHRAIIWLDYNNDGTWSAPSLKDYKGEWSCDNSDDYRTLSGILRFTDITQSHKNVSINLDSLGRQSGYLTMGDNPKTNTAFDEPGHSSHPIGADDIRSVAVMELPWLGVIKVYMTENKRSYLDNVPNSIWCIVMVFVAALAIIYCFDVFYLRKELRQKQKELKRLREL